MLFRSSPGLPDDIVVAGDGVLPTPHLEDHVEPDPGVLSCLHLHHHLHLLVHTLTHYKDRDRREKGREGERDNKN